MAGKPRILNVTRFVREMSRSALLLALVSCAASYQGTLDSRTLPEEKRYEFLKARGSETSQEIRNAFIDGQVVRGMPRNWVLELYGPPDGFLDSGWEYRDNQGTPLLRIFFEQDILDSIATDLRGRR